MSALPAVRSAISGISWPGIPGAEGARMLALQWQLAQSEWLPPAELRALQMRQAGALLEHAAAHVPHYRDALAAFAPEDLRAPGERLWARVPILERTEIPRLGPRLWSEQVPPEHGGLTEFHTSGSLGRPLRGRGTALTAFLWRGFALRDHLWHGRDLQGKLAAIRTKVEKPLRVQGWGPITDSTYATGAAAALNIATGIGEQLRWLQAEAPDYLLTHPSNARALLLEALRLGVSIPRLREIRTFGEALPEDLRSLARRAWDAKLTDAYSCEELGTIALQCPQHEHYHVQSESVIVEVLDERGAACAPGETGRVVITDLHNFAQPFIRYAIGDYAEAGGACPCGRGLPVLARVAGRVRNMALAPDGRRYWPSFPEEAWGHIAPIRQIQLVQTGLDAIEARVVVERPLSSAEEVDLAGALRRALGHPYRVAVLQVPEIGRSANFKFEDFICRVEQGA